MYLHFFLDISCVLLHGRCFMCIIMSQMFHVEYAFYIFHVYSYMAHVSRVLLCRRYFTWSMCIVMSQIFHVKYVF